MKIDISKKKALSLEEIKEIEYGILNEFRAFCERNSIRYFLAYGTLLGAIRYKGFIPWDDDLDVLVPRKDYNRFIALYRDNGRFRLDSIERNKKYGYPFAKLCDVTTLKIEGTDGGVDNGIQQGIDIDIFPLDYWNDDIEKAYAEVKRLKRSRHWLNIAKMAPQNGWSYLKKLAFSFVHLLAKSVGTHFWIEQILKTSCSADNEKSRYMGNKVWFPYFERDIIPSEAFSDTVEVEFEGAFFHAPVGYDTYLTCLYGDYLPEPPKEKQKTHHIFKAYKLTENEIQINS